MIIGLMALLGQPGHVCLWRSDRNGNGGSSGEQGIFSQVPADRRNDFQLIVPDGMVRYGGGRRDRCPGEPTAEQMASEQRFQPQRGPTVIGCW